MRIFQMGMWVVFLSLISCAQLHVRSPSQETLPPGELNRLVQKYLATENREEERSLLGELKSRKGVSIEKLEEAIENGRVYPPLPPVGSSHQSVRVDDLREMVGGRNENHSDQTEGAPNGEESYALYVPEKYDPSVSYPLIVCLHGAGFNGDVYLDRWKPRLGEKMILACPTMEDGAWWTLRGEKLVLAVIESVKAKVRVDPNRIYLTGMSNGGIGAHLIGAFHADRLAAVAPMAGGIPDEVFPVLRNLSGVGVYIIHGEKDQVMPVTLSRKISDYLHGEGIAHVYREHLLEHPMAGGHFFPKEELPALVEWLDRQRRNSAPSRVVAIRDKAHLGPFYWTEIDETSGEVADVLGSIFDPSEAKRVKEGAFAALIAEVHANRVEVKCERVGRYTLFFNRRLIDFSRPVVIMTNGRKTFEGILSESAEILLKETKRRGDAGALYPASVTIDVAASQSQ